MTDVVMGKDYVERIKREYAEIDALKTRVGQDVVTKSLVMNTGGSLELGVIAKFLDGLFRHTKHVISNACDGIAFVAHESPEIPGWRFEFRRNGEVYMPWPRNGFSVSFDDVITHAARVVVLSKSDAVKSLL